MIPPAWTDVWISPDPLGHLQATGRDDRGRKQYRYHDDWRVVRDQDKFDQLGDFGAALTSIRPAAEHDLRRRGMPTRKVLALVVRLLDLTLVRIGNDVYADDNETYGLTTLLGEHASVSGSSVTFRFVGKSGSEQEVSFRDRRLARIVGGLPRPRRTTAVRARRERRTDRGHRRRGERVPPRGRWS